TMAMQLCTRNRRQRTLWHTWLHQPSALERSCVYTNSLLRLASPIRTRQSPFESFFATSAHFSTELSTVDVDNSGLLIGNIRWGIADHAPHDLSTMAVDKFSTPSTFQSRKQPVSHKCGG